MSTFDAMCAAFAARHLGILTRADVFRFGGTDECISIRLQRHQWVQLFPGVYLVGSGPPTWLQRQYAACLAAGPESAAPIAEPSRPGSWMDTTRASSSSRPRRRSARVLTAWCCTGRCGGT
ncbi:MAG TPA: type IV toxin-antitoxin system AbiEi family antitoxin domain-containing protein, partial [Acidimicrobiales bacterium]|nr:type IV toxin-antitoxin system AbiEi family antitoxin domain-containing protein [Acidimicrobiales bacterium]